MTRALYATHSPPLAEAKPPSAFHPPCMTTASFAIGACRSGQTLPLVLAAQTPACRNERKRARRMPSAVPSTVPPTPLPAAKHRRSAPRTTNPCVPFVCPGVRERERDVEGRRQILGAALSSAERVWGAMVMVHNNLICCCEYVAYPPIAVDRYMILSQLHVRACCGLWACI